MPPHGGYLLELVAEGGRQVYGTTSRLADEANDALGQLIPDWRKVPRDAEQRFIRLIVLKEFLDERKRPRCQLIRHVDQ